MLYCVCGMFRARYAVSAVMKRIAVENPHVAMFAVQVNSPLSSL